MSIYERSITRKERDSNIDRTYTSPLTIRKKLDARLERKSRMHIPSLYTWKSLESRPAAFSWEARLSNFHWWRTRRLWALRIRGRLTLRFSDHDRTPFSDVSCANKGLRNAPRIFVNHTRVRRGTHGRKCMYILRTPLIRAYPKRRRESRALSIIHHPLCPSTSGCRIKRRDNPSIGFSFSNSTINDGIAR